jgi:hypothetical protein
MFGEILLGDIVREESPFLPEVINWQILTMMQDFTH